MLSGYGELPIMCSDFVTPPSPSVGVGPPPRAVINQCLALCDVRPHGHLWHVSCRRGFKNSGYKKLS